MTERSEPHLRSEDFRQEVQLVAELILGEAMSEAVWGYTIIPNGSRKESVICCKCRRPFEEGDLYIDRPQDPWPGAQMIRHHELCPEDRVEKP